uniref:uncharacterized protein LOC120326724 n=1 Tax=Styela clava TaxID=7725 RepID=UPI00193991EF|nr:uncharacterized protein LOC120326724 [Styela clava]
MLSSIQIFNIPNQILELDELGTKIIMQYNGFIASENIRTVIFLRDVLRGNYEMRKENVGESQVDCYTLPSPGQDIFRAVPRAAMEFKRALLDHLRRVVTSLEARTMFGQLVSGSQLLVYLRELDMKNIRESIKRAREIIRGVLDFRQQINDRVPHREAIENVLKNLSAEDRKRIEEYITIEVQRMQEAGEGQRGPVVTVIAENIQSVTVGHHAANDKKNNEQK